MRSLKLVVLSCVVFASAVAQADLLAARVEKGNQTVDGVSYETNAKLGRAWINVEFSEPCDTGKPACSAPVTVRAKFPGLTLDAGTGAVLFAEKASDEPVVCARVAKHWYGTQLEATKLCGVTRVEETTEVVDDGYNTREVKYLDVYFGKLTGRRGD